MNIRSAVPAVCRLLPVALLATAAAAPLASVAAQTIGIHMGSTGTTNVAPGATVTVPVIVDMTNAGSATLVGLQGEITWNSARLVFDSIRAVGASGWALTTNASSAALGSLNLTATRPTSPPGAATIANLYLRAVAAGGTRIMFAPFGAASATQTNSLPALRPRGLDVCAAVPGKWGDVNNDATVTIADAQQIARSSVGLSVTDANAIAQRGDVTADGFVTIADAQQIARFSVQLSASPRVNTDVFTPPVATVVTATPGTAQTLGLGGSRQVVARALNGALDHTGCAITTWSSSSPSVTVNSSGYVSAVSAGAAVVSVTSGAASATVTVSVAAVPVSSVTVTLGSTTIGAGATTQASAIMRDGSGAALTGRTVAWISTDPSVATIDPVTGLVRGTASGTTGILGVSEGVTGFAQVVVSGGGGGGAPVSSVSVALASSINIFATTQATATLRDASNNVLTGRVVNWASGNPSVATVNQTTGVVTGLAPGPVQITATSEGVTGQANMNVTVSTAPVASVQVSLGSASLQPLGTTTATAILRDALNNVLVGRPITWSSSNPLVATINPLSGAIVAVAVGTTNIIALSEGISGQIQLAVGLTNEPPGMTVLADRPFDCIKVTACESGWFLAEGVPGTIVLATDPTAPRSASSVLQQTFTSALPGGSSPGAVGRDFPGSEQKQTLYVAYWMLLSSNFVGHPSNINKTVFFPIAASNRVYTMVQGTGTVGPMNVAVGLQGLPVDYSAGGVTGSSVNLTPNIVNVPIVRGVWHKYEVLFVANTGGSPNGTVEMWIDGLKVMRYQGITYARSTENARWEGVNWGPIWGGAGGTIGTPFFAQMDHMYFSGK